MKKQLLWLLRQLINWLEDGPPLARVSEMVAWADTLNISGERKRGQVLNRLIAEFPNSRTKDIAFAIERVIQEKD